jgi:hypothetical protein
MDLFKIQFKTRLGQTCTIAANVQDWNEAQSAGNMNVLLTLEMPTWSFACVSVMDWNCLDAFCRQLFCGEGTANLFSASEDVWLSIVSDQGGCSVRITAFPLDFESGDPTRLSRLETGEFSIDPEEVDRVREMLRRVESIIRDRCNCEFRK